LRREHVPLGTTPTSRVLAPQAGRHFVFLTAQLLAARDAHFGAVLRARASRIDDLNIAIGAPSDEEFAQKMLRLALVYATESGLGVCAPLHDAIFVVAPEEQEEWATQTLRECMQQAAVDLIGVEIPIEMFVIRYPERFVPDDKPMAVAVWDKMMAALERAEARETNL
jgi:hypothetical protein